MIRACVVCSCSGVCVCHKSFYGDSPMFTVTAFLPLIEDAMIRQENLLDYP